MLFMIEKGIRGIMQYINMQYQIMNIFDNYNNE